MDANEKLIKTFATRVRQMILQYQEIRKENTELYAMVDDRDKQITELKARVERLSRDYDSLKMARMMQITDGDVEASRKRLGKLIRDVNKCITLLSQQQ